ncbi:MAG: hypothetical protein KDB75_10685, partial [Flavobacteriales bacterium]|nr:hypothetical protein [Flavobacteriales bacterium]MCB0789761.1 hypothetical protein [Flavobacteriales bacterium]
MQVRVGWLPLVFLLHPSLGQELVVNGGFEDHRRCPGKFDQRPVRGVKAVRPIGGMPGYFH